MLFQCQENFCFQGWFTLGPSYTFVLLAFSLDLNDHSFLAFVLLIIFIETNHKSTKDVHIDLERKKTRNSMTDDINS